MPQALFSSPLARRWTATAAAGALLLLSACAPSGEPGEAPAPPEQKIVVPYSSDITGVNEITTQSTTLSTALFYFALFTPLAQERADYAEGPPTFEPRLAESWEHSDDGLTLTFHLREDALWSDGEPITAEDVRFTWEAQTSPDTAWAWKDYKKGITDVEVVDEHEVAFHFAARDANQLHDAVQGVILPKHAWSELPLAEWAANGQWFVDHLVVSGPFDLESWEPGQRVVLRKNERYFGAPELPRAESIVFEIIPDAQNRLAMLRAGEGHYLDLVQPEDAGEIEANPELKLLPYTPRFYPFLGWNVENPLFESARVRRALTQAIDRRAIVDTIYYGYADLSHSPINDEVWAHNDEIEPWPYDPAKAREMLAAEGWEDTDGDGILDRDGTPFRFELVTNSESPIRRDIVAMVQEQLAKVGVDVDTRLMEFNSLLEPLSEHEFDAVVSMLAISTDLDLSHMFHTDAIDTGYNWGAYSNPALDELLEAIGARLVPEENLEDLHRVQEILHEEQPVTFLYQAVRLAAARKNLEGADPDALSPFSHLEEWHLAPMESVTESVE